MPLFSRRPRTPPKSRPAPRRRRKRSALRAAAIRLLAMSVAGAVAGLLERNPDAGSAERESAAADPRRKTTHGGPADVAQPGRGRSATSPTEIPTPGWKDILWRTYEEINNDRVMAIAAGVTFYALLALFPAIAAFVAIYGLFADPATIQSHLDQAKEILPYGASDIIGEQLKTVTAKGSSTLGITFIVSLLISLWSANSGVKAMLDALNIAYNETEKRSFIKLNAISLVFTLGGFVFLILAIGAVVVVPIVLNVLPLGPALTWVVAIGRWVALLLVVVLALALLYRYGPSRTEPQWRWVTPGSAAAAIVWVVASGGLSIYASHFANYDKTYGSLGAAIGFMIWMWVSTIIILAGAELNSEIEHQTARDTTEKKGAPMGARGAVMADTVGRST
ncbi:YihY/virulence factor BrkB family protein [Alsobacter sp. KACC 23698]|uniref:YihY/virulence factor BrkB family protein n=1 Tax=Alsobacter sp. KACC 23698 TaxID=3149229 RepID=A0AAU7JBD8_9HYPH